MRALIAVVLGLGLALTTSAPAAFAAAKGPKPPQQDWPHHGIFGTYDKAALQRGFQVFQQACNSCHATRFLDYRHLAALGFTETEVKAIAANYEVQDGPDEFGEMFTRTAIPSDPFNKPFPNEQAARAANGGAYPKDLSLIVRARAYKEDYLYALLTGYVPDDQLPEGVEPRPGQYYNEYYSGHWIAMAPPLIEGVITYDDGTEATVEQMARDVTQFLAWMSVPELEQRKSMGLMVMLFLITFAGIMYVVKKRVWADLDH